MKRRLRLLCLLLMCGLLFGCGRQETLPILETEPPATEKSAVAVEFPCTSPDGLLVAETLHSYSGPYWEDGSGQWVENVAGLMLCNPTNKMVEFAAFSLEQDGQKLYFFAYRIPPNSRCLVLEYEKRSCDPARVTACRELCVRWRSQELSREQIDYLGLGATLTVINRSRQQLTCVTVWYKAYDREGEYYLGGAAFSCRLLFLLPDERRMVMPENYGAGQSKIVEIITEM